MFVKHDQMQILNMHPDQDSQLSILGGGGRIDI